MIVTAVPARARWGARIRLAVLVAAALLVSHTAIYAIQDGLGAAFGAAMTLGGHDGWWLPAALAILGGGVLVAGSTIARLLRLEVRARRATAVHGLRRHQERDPGLGPEALTIGRRLIPLVLAAFTIQENVEQLIAHGRLLGIDALVGPDHPLALPVLVVVSVGLSCLGAVVRWRSAILRDRVADASVALRPRGSADRIGAAWRTVGALAPLRWMLDRPDAGRSPPILRPT